MEHWWGTVWVREEEGVGSMYEMEHSQGRVWVGEGEVEEGVEH